MTIKQLILFEDQCDSKKEVLNKRKAKAEPQITKIENLTEEIICSAEDRAFLNFLTKRDWATWREYLDAIGSFLSIAEKQEIENAAKLDLWAQVCFILKEFWPRVEMKFLEIVGWRKEAIAEIVEPAKILPTNPPMRCVVLRLKSRELDGNCAFKSCEAKQARSSRFPTPVIKLMYQMSPYFSFRFLEPLYKDRGRINKGHNKREICRSFKDILASYPKPVDPICAGALIVNLPFNILIKKVIETCGSYSASERNKLFEVKRRILLLGHWD